MNKWLTGGYWILGSENVNIDWICNGAVCWKAAKTVHLAVCLDYIFVTKAG